MSDPLFPLEDTLGGEHPDRRKIKTGAHPWAPSQLDAWAGIDRTEAFSMKSAEQVTQDAFDAYAENLTPDEREAFMLDAAGNWRSFIEDAIRADRAQRETEDEPIYWQNADEGRPETHIYGNETAGIVDEEQGGIIAYCHVDSANEIVQALLAYRKKWSA